VANEELLAILRRGVKTWNDWIERNGGFDLSGPGLKLRDLTSADLTGVNLAGIDLSTTNLSWAKLAGAKLDEASLRGTALRGADLSGASVSISDLTLANLTEANLSNASLRGTNFYAADLTNTNFAGASITNAIFSYVDVSATKGLELAIYEGRSTIGIDTVVLSRGRIPDALMRGAGVPDTWITYIKSLSSSPIEFYSCFISYSTKDQDFANRLHADLQAKGVRCWFAPHDVKGGQKLHAQIDEAIRFHDKLLLILSEHSMSSEWVQTEISKARKREVREKVRVLFPISLAQFEAIREWECFDADMGKDSAREIREYYIPDFSNWKDDDCYQKAFDRLVSDLKALQA
jgi:uncharacterized protein YjbI with pentapeptide repeats